jgi:energy-coupling factor transporter ATP-binding protein EcfA2
LEADLVVIFGPNGYGKSSLTEAIEWLLYGRTKRRERGETLSQRDYQGSYRNIHAPQSEVTYVEALVSLQDGTEHRIRRELKIGPRNVEESTTLIDGIEGDFMEVGILADDQFNPVIAQHSLQDFIHSKPKDRRDKISAAFGLEMVVRYKTVCDKARSRFQKSPPTIVLGARNTLSQLSDQLQYAPDLDAVRSRWTKGKVDLNKDQPPIRKAAHSLLGNALVPDTMLASSLQALREDIAARVFDVKDLTPIQNLERGEPELNKAIDKLDELANETSTALDAFLSAAGLAFSEDQLTVWRLALRLTSSDTVDQCPVCEQNTFSTERKRNIRQRLDQSAGRNSAKQKLQETTHHFATQASTVFQIMTSLFPQPLDEQQAEKLRALIGTDGLMWSRFDAAHLKMTATLLQLTNSRNTTIADIGKLTDLALRTDMVVRAREIPSEIIRLVKGCAEIVKLAAAKFATECTSISSVVATKVSEATSVREIDALLGAWKALPSINALKIYEDLLTESQDAIRQTEEFIQAKQKELFETRGREINDWYDTMNLGANVRFARLQPATDALYLWAESFGIPLNAIACLSECQLNCLGISIHLMRILTPGTCFATIVLDDPVQSMDDDHSHALIDPVISKLVADKGLQVIVLSHDKKMADEIVNLHRNRNLSYLVIDEFTKDGPNITFVETLADILKRASHLAKGNENLRRDSLVALRRGAETLMREACKAAGVQEPPIQSMASAMYSYFEQVPEVTSQMASHIRQVVNFSNLAPHTGPGNAPPVQSNISAQINRLTTIAQQLGLA